MYSYLFILSNLEIFSSINNFIMIQLLFSIGDERRE